MPTPRSPDLPRLQPQEALGLRAWRALLDDGTPVCGRWLAPAPAGPGGRPLVEPLRDIRSPALVPVLGLARTDRGVWLVSELDDGVSLGRLRRRAGLSAAQVAAVLDAVLDALDALHSRGLASGGVHDENVLVGCDGRVRLADWAPGALDARPGADAEGDVAAAGALAAALLREAHAAPPDVDATLAALRRVRHLADLRAVVPRLGTAEQATARAELAALAGAVRGRTATPATGAPELANPPEVGRRGVPERAGGRPPRRTWSVLWRAGLAVVVGVVVVAGEMHLFGDRVTADLRTLRPPSASAEAPTATAVPALPRLGPASAGAVAAVQAGAVGACAPGRACLLRVTVQVVPAAQPRAVRWDVVAGRQCGGPLATVATGEASVPAGADHVTATQQVTLPEQGPLAVGVVTRSPDEAASPALPAPPGAVTC